MLISWAQSLHRQHSRIPLINPYSYIRLLFALHCLRRALIYLLGTRTVVATTRLQKLVAQTLAVFVV